MDRQLVLTNVRAEELAEVTKSFLADGARKVDTMEQPDGTYTVTAVFDDDEASQASATP